MVPPNAHEATYVRSYYGPPYAGKCPWHTSPSLATILCQALPMIQRRQRGFMYFPDLTFLDPRFKTDSLCLPHSARQPSNDTLVLLATPGGVCRNDTLPIPKVLVTIPKCCIDPQVPRDPGVSCSPAQSNSQYQWHIYDL